MSFIERILNSLAYVGEMSAYGIIETNEEISDEFHIADAITKDAKDKVDDGPTYNGDNNL